MQQIDQVEKDLEEERNNYNLAKLTVEQEAAQNNQVLLKQDKVIRAADTKLKENIGNWEEKLHQKQRMIDLLKEIQVKKKKDFDQLVQKRESSKQIIWFREEQRRYEDQLEEINKKNRMLLVVESGYRDEIARQKAVLNE